MPSTKTSSLLKNVVSTLEKRPGLHLSLNIDPNILHNGEPSPELVENLYTRINEDRINKTANVAYYLRRVVRNRDCLSISKKIGISNTTLANVIDGKNRALSYENIDKIEVFLSSIDDVHFNCSSDNQLTKQQHLLNELQPLSVDITQSSLKIVNNLHTLIEELLRLSANKGEVMMEFNSGKLNQSYRQILLNKKDMDKLIDGIILLADTYIPKIINNNI